MDDVKRNLESLHEDLKEVDKAEGETPEKVTQMMSTVSDALDNLDDETHRETLLDQLEEALLEFEAEHPKLVGRMRAMVQTLSNAGI